MAEHRNPGGAWRFVLVGLALLLPWSRGALAADATEKGRTEVDLSGPGWKLWYDKDAPWEQDELFLPPVDLTKLPVNPPTGGWGVLDSAPAAPAALDVAVPGTAEEYLQHGEGPSGDIRGVTWWWRTVRIPDSASPRRLLLHFDSARLRSEVYVNHKLVAYDLVGNTPFEADITDAAKPGEECQLAVRVTDPGGNFSWQDYIPFTWGRYTIPMSHGFGGITGRVKLIACDDAYVNDLYVQNTPTITDVNVEVTVRNAAATEVRRDIVLRVVDKRDASVEMYREGHKDVAFAPGETRKTFKVSVPHAKLWDLDHPNLYVCEVSLGTGETTSDSERKTFGFRWFAPEGVGKDAVFRLNGKRIVLRTAISWGFWPINGIFPTPELAEKQVRTAKALGLNMLNFHRCIGQPIVLDKADELGLLYYEEPGGYVSGDKEAFAHDLSRQKLLRMVRRDRSHPSLVIYNMINEQWVQFGASTLPDVFAWHETDLKDAHAIDPSRTITHTSAWAKAEGAQDKAKMHMRPFDDTVHMQGWYDYHRAGGPEVWQQRLYRDPKHYYGLIDDQEEIVYYGEEGAISSPPRLQEIKGELDAAPRKGWDGQVYLDWYQAFDDFLTRKKLRSAFPTVEALTSAMGSVSLEHQGRKIENIRISNVVDGYAVNGWEAEIVENHSGIVDCFRNPKGEGATLAYYNQPLYVAVKPRSQVVQIPAKVAVDFYVVNEKDLKGEHTLKVRATDPSGREVFAHEAPVSLAGGETYGQLLAEGVAVPVSGATGMFSIEATLTDGAGKVQAQGRDQVLAVDWKGAAVPGGGAVWEVGNHVRRFLQSQKDVDVPAYADNLGRLDWVVVTRAPNEGATAAIPADRLQDPSGKAGGLAATFFAGDDFQKPPVHRRIDKGVDLSVEEGATPDPAVPLTEAYLVRWEGQVVPPANGTYTFVATASGGVRLSVGGRTLFDAWQPSPASGQVHRGQIDLEAGKPVPLTLEYSHPKGAARCKLVWSVPEAAPPDPKRLLDRVRDDGTTLLLLDRPEAWMDLVGQYTPARCGGTFTIGTAWLGGLHFVKSHPLFKDLPTDVAMNWPYQAVVRDGRNRFGLLLEGEELVAGCWHCYPMQLGTAVGVLPCGKGRIVVSTLDISGNLESSESPADVARKLLCNFIEYAGAAASREAP